MFVASLFMSRTLTFQPYTLIQTTTGVQLHNKFLRNTNKNSFQTLNIHSILIKALGGVTNFMKVQGETAVL